MWLKKFISYFKHGRLHKKTTEPILSQSYNKKPSTAANYIDIKYHVAKKKVQNQTIKPKYIRTNQMRVDAFNKELLSNLFRKRLADSRFNGVPVILD